ncbi:type IV toxin-antitoxin system AbiEi family antitoxin domain-containing protein [Kribbella koreensis]|uniref:Type IV toxin-antitoxin system AbiEi family antitoxin domain-containing protein n=2 Tax=Kribbella koreensis TaxID=57909 RepID=A0ABP4BHX1_9ACTN
MDNPRRSGPKSATISPMVVSPTAVAQVLGSANGLATFAELRASVSGDAIRKALAAGSIQRLAKGVYALPPVKDPEAAARAQGGVVSHSSAAVLHGFDVLEAPTTAQVTVPRGQHRRASTLACDLYWADDVPAFDGRTTKLRTVLDCARALPFADGLCVADSALRKGAIQRDRLMTAAAGLAGPGSARVRRVAAAADGRAESPLESVLRARLLEAGFDEFVPQWVVRDKTFSARIDLAQPRLKLALEADSFAHHGSRSALTRDCRRHANLTIRGWRLIRFSWEDVMLDPGWVVDVVTKALQPPSHQSPTVVTPVRLTGGAAVRV